MDLVELGRHIVYHVKPYLPSNFVSIDVYYDCTGETKPSIRAYANIKNESKPFPMWSGDMIENLKKDFENFKIILQPKRIIKVQFHCELNGEFTFNCDYKK